MKKALVAMSGGVDSSVTAILMQERGYDCVGVTMQLWRETAEGGCGSSADARDAARVACHLGFPHHLLNYTEAFRENVVCPFVASYGEGKTPNPCILCNATMKFGKLFEVADELGCEKIATGHYVRIERQNGKYLLKKALDPSKDQSYVLYFLSQTQLARLCFPLGEMKKSDARLLAEERGLATAHKHDSQDICFVPDGDYASLIERLTGKRAEPGNYIDRDGKILGRHKGVIHYTIGQHKRLGISTSVPLYVGAINPRDNTVTLCTNEDLFVRDLDVANVSFVSGETPAEPFRAFCKIRYRQTEQPARITPLGGGRIHVTFDEPQRAVTPGQTAVLYDGDTVLGGGIIE